MNMKRFFKGFSSVLVVLLMGTLLALPAAAKDSTVTIGASSVRHIDGGGYLTDEEEKDLEAQAVSVSESTDMGVYVVFSREDVSDEEVAALTVLKEKIASGGGYGDSDGAIILYVNMTSRKYAVVEKDDTAKGRLSSKFIEKLTSSDSKIQSLLAAKDNYNAVKTFIGSVKDELAPGFFKTIWFKLLAALGIGGAAAGISVGSHKALPKTKKRHYLKNGTVAVLSKNERRTGTNIRRIAPSEKKGSEKDHKVGENAHGGSNTF